MITQSVHSTDSQLFRSRASSLPGANRPIGLWPVRSLELSHSRVFAPRNIRCRELSFPVSPWGTIFVCGASDFSHFFDMTACPNHTTTSSYRCILGLTKRSPVITTNIFTPQHQVAELAAPSRKVGTRRVR